MGDEAAGGDPQLTEADKRDNVIRLAFGGSEERFKEFLDVIRQEIPPGTSVVHAMAPVATILGALDNCRPGSRRSAGFSGAAGGDLLESASGGGDAGAPAAPLPSRLPDSAGYRLAATGLD